MSDAVTHYIRMAPSFSAAVYFCYKRCDIANYRALKYYILCVLPLTHPNLSTRLLCMNVSFLWITGVLYIRTWLQLPMRPKPAHPVDFLILFFHFYLFYYCFKLFYYYYYYYLAILRCSVLDNKRDYSPHKSALSCLCYMFSVPCLGLLCHFLSPVVFVVSLYLLVLDFYVTSCLPWCL